MKMPILLTVTGNPENQDRGLVVHDGSRTVLCIADGAGGRSGGTEAAALVIRLIRQSVTRITDVESCLETLRQLDAFVAQDSLAGETTFVLAVVTSEEVFGASVGDSGAWLIPATGDIINLTRGQQRKPFIGCGSTNPMAFRHPNIKGSLLLATDGLLKYTSAEKITAVCREHPTEIAAQRLIELVRYPSGAFPDDVTVILGEL
jgi:serine/threonine protein phosphatase PrpC